LPDRHGGGGDAGQRDRRIPLHAGGPEPRPDGGLRAAGAGRVEGSALSGKVAAKFRRPFRPLQVSALTDGGGGGIPRGPRGRSGAAAKIIGNSELSVGRRCTPRPCSIVKDPRSEDRD